MARSIRIEYPGAFYHIMARGNRRESIFLDDDDRRFFLKALGECCAMTGWRVHAWVLMDNHYHLLIETPAANLVAGMQWLQNTYTRRFNVRHRMWGRLFGDRYKAAPVESGGYYYETLLDYIHLNPVRAGIIKLGKKTAAGLLDYPWSSLPAYCKPPKQRAPWLAVQSALASVGFQDTTAGRRAWLRALEKRALQESAERCGMPPLEAAAQADARISRLDRGWYWGSQTFAERLLEISKTILKHKRSGSYQHSAESHAHDQKQAERLLEEGLKAARLSRKELPHLPGSDPRKVAIAMVIRQQTTVSLTWLAEHLSMRSRYNACQQIRRFKKTAPKLSERLKTWFNQSTSQA